jgi:hypothetical protein
MIAVKQEIDEQELQDAQDQRLAVRAETETAISETIANAPGFERLEAISDEDWNEAVLQDKQRNWPAVVENMTNVQRLVHLAMRQGPEDETRIRNEVLEARRRAYVSEMTILAKRVGCSNRSGKLTTGPTLSDFSDDSQEDGESIVNTYNYDLAHAILNIAQEVPTANRHTYVSRLRSWESERSVWKSKQITLNTDGLARQRAIDDFGRFNDIEGVAVLKPDGAAEEICQGWQARGEVPLREATRNPPPYHLNCPHYWEPILNRVSRQECQELWVGE